LGFQAVTDLSEVQNGIDQLKTQGKKTALLFVSNADGVNRFVALPCDSSRAVFASAGQ
jgi:hypothetical protein